MGKGRGSDGFNEAPAKNGGELRLPAQAAAQGACFNEAPAKNGGECARVWLAFWHSYRLQ